jgi:hypothetical protein
MSNVYVVQVTKRRDKYSYVCPKHSEVRVRLKSSSSYEEPVTKCPECGTTLEQELVPAFDLSPASKLGTPRVLLDSGSVLHPVPIVQRLRHKLKDFNDDDFLLPVGDPVAICMAAMVAGQMNRGRVKFLRWDRNIDQYFVFQADISGRPLALGEIDGH